MAARFQCAVNRRFDADLLIELLAGPGPDALPAGRHAAPDRATGRGRCAALVAWSRLFASPQAAWVAGVGDANESRVTPSRGAVRRGVDGGGGENW